MFLNQLDESYNSKSSLRIYLSREFYSKKFNILFNSKASKLFIGDQYSIYQKAMTAGHLRKWNFHWITQTLKIIKVSEKFQLFLFISDSTRKIILKRWFQVVLTFEYKKQLKILWFEPNPWIFNQNWTNLHWKSKVFY